MRETSYILSNEGPIYARNVRFYFSYQQYIFYIAICIHCILRSTLRLYVIPLNCPVISILIVHDDCVGFL